MSVARLALLLVTVSAQLAHAAPPQRYESRVRKRVKREVTTTTITVEEARHVAGTGGDALKVVQALPGVARAAFGSGQLVVWGSAPEDTRVTLDGMDLPALYHLGGLRSSVNDALVRDLSFSPGGFGAADGRGLGGLVRLDSRPLSQSGFHGYVAADVLDASALVTATIGRLSIAAAARYSYVDALLGKLVSPEAGDYFPIPRYDDYQLKATLRLRPNEEVSLLFVAADDHLRRTVPADDPTRVRSETEDDASYRLQLRYRNTRGDDVVTVAPWLGWDRRAREQRFGPTPAALTVESWRYGLRAESRRVLSPRWQLAFGLDAAGTRARVSRSGSITLPPREGDVYVFGQPPGDDQAQDRFSAHLLDAAPFVEAQLRAGPVTLTPSLRLDAWLIEVDRVTPEAGLGPPTGASRLSWDLDPRVQLSVRAHPRVTLNAACGLYHQAPAPEDLSSVFGNPRLGLARAVHATGGLSVRATDGLSIEALGFYKYLDQLPARSDLAQPELARALVQEGTGRAYGGQVLVRLESGGPWHGLSGWVSYTLSRAERRDHPGGPLRLFDYDQTHVLALVATWQHRGWTVGGRFRWSSGYPRTPVIGAIYDVRDDRYQPRFGAQNSVRLPDFVQLDLRLERAFVWSRAQLALSLDVQNVTYQRNAEELAYSADFSKRGYITGLPTLAVLGAKVLW